MTTLTDLTIADALSGLSKKDFTVTELTQAHIDAIAEKKHLNCFITETPERALAQAKASDACYANGDIGKLEGIPLAIKDLFCTEGVRTTAASKMLENFVPAYESTVTQKLKDAGMVMLGKVSNDEFAMGSSNTTSAYGNVINPWRRKSDDRDLVPGGTSGGSAAAVAARIALGATGTDTGGSIRQPAALCGVVGVKPTYGRCSRWGTIAFASSLDQAGALTRTVKDAALFMEVIAGYDSKDMTSVDTPVPEYSKSLGQGVKGKRVGIPREYRVDGMLPEVEANWHKGIEWLKDAGAEPVEITLPYTKYAMAAYYIIAPAECSSNLARYDGIRYGVRMPGKDLTELYENTRAEGFGAEVRRRILIGTYVLSAGYFDSYYVRAQKVRTLIAQDFKAAFEKCDFILTPPAPSTAFPIGEKTDNPITMYLEDMFTIPASMAGLPGISVPSALSKDGLPLGLQIIGKPFDEIGVFNAAEAIEKAAQFMARP